MRGMAQAKTDPCAKAAGARRWVDAVNYAGTFGRWAYRVCRDIDSLRTLLDVVAATGMG